MTNANPVHRYPTITPHLGVDDPAAALDFYKRAFGARELVRLALPGRDDHPCRDACR
jgi:PhnB protein